MDFHNIFTVKIYKNVNIFVPEALGDLPPTPTSLVEKLYAKL